MQLSVGVVELIHRNSCGAIAGSGEHEDAAGADLSVSKSRAARGRVNGKRQGELGGSGCRDAKKPQSVASGTEELTIGTE